MTSPDLTDTAAMPSAAFWAGLSVELTSAAQDVRTHYHRRDRMFRSLHRVPLIGPSLQVGALMCDRPDIMGPPTGMAWDVRRLTFASADVANAWSGTIYVYMGTPSAVNQVDVFLTPGTHTYPKGSMLLSGHDRLVYLATAGFSGVAIPGGEAIQLVDELLPDYLS